MSHSTRPWTNLPVITTNNGSATPLLAAKTAVQALLVSNEDATASLRVRFDGQDADASTGTLVPPQKALFFGPGNVPVGKISGYATAAIQVSVAYVA